MRVFGHKVQASVFLVRHWFLTLYTAFFLIPPHIYIYILDTVFFKLNNAACKLFRNKNLNFRAREVSLNIDIIKKHIY